MRLLFLPKEGLDLFRTLLDSETSRRVLRFYHPRRSPFGVAVDVGTLSSGLSLVSELRWYVRRYVSGVLFETAPGRYATLALASEVYYGRELRLHEPWESRFLLIARDGTIERIPIDPGTSPAEYEEECRGAGEVLEVWDVTENEGPQRASGPAPVPARAPVDLDVEE
jgi:hypothetical protein